MILWGLVIGLLVGFAIATLWAGYRRKPPFLASAEYWVYLPSLDLPPQTEIMHRMLAGNPHRHALGPREGILFSDVRLHIGLVLKAKNPHAFGPSAFSEEVAASPEQIKALSQSASFARVRYISEQPLPDQRHITFLAHAAEAIADLAKGSFIYDQTTERLMTPDELTSALDQDSTGLNPRLHLRVLWKGAPLTGHAETRGLRKIGFDELITAAMEPDERVLVTAVLEEAAHEIWRKNAAPEELEVTAFDDLFKVNRLKPHQGFQPVKILRVQAL